MPNTALAVIAAKLSAEISRRFRLGSGTNLPGKVALKLSPKILGTLAGQVRQKTVAITGTNGKSTTAGLLASLIEAAGSTVVHNQLGANMLAGITAALALQSNWLGKLSADYGVIEADEASLPGVAGQIKPQLTVVTNLFRDQLDRYGELDTTAKLIRKGIEAGSSVMALNADDPMVTAIARNYPTEKVIYYGVESVLYPETAPIQDFPVGFPLEITDCPICQAPLDYTRIIYGHLGHYQCSACDFKRPDPQFTAREIRIGIAESHVNLTASNGFVADVTLHLPGLFNAYNLLSAACAFHWLGLPSSALSPGVASYQSIFGRAESMQLDGKSLMFLLIKNPMGATEVLKVVTADPNARLLIAINDDYADGRDISWLWDAPFEWLITLKTPITVAGHRADDMAVRLLYGGVAQDQIQVVSDAVSALNQAVIQTQSNETLYVLPTYTALLSLSHHLHTR